MPHDGTLSRRSTIVRHRGTIRCGTTMHLNSAVRCCTDEQCHVVASVTHGCATRQCSSTVHSSAALWCIATMKHCSASTPCSTVLYSDISLPATFILVYKPLVTISSHSIYQLLYFPHLYKLALSATTTRAPVEMSLQYIVTALGLNNVFSIHAEVAQSFRC